MADKNNRKTTYRSEIVEADGNEVCENCNGNESLNCIQCEGTGRQKRYQRNICEIPRSTDADTSIASYINNGYAHSFNKPQKNNWLQNLLKLLLSLLLLLALLALFYHLLRNNFGGEKREGAKDPKLDQKLESAKKKTPSAKKKSPHTSGKHSIGDIDRDKLDRNLYFYGELINKEMLKNSKIDWSDITRKDIEKITPKLKERVESFCREQLKAGKECYTEVLAHPSLEGRQYKRIGDKVLNELKDERNEP